MLARLKQSSKGFTLVELLVVVVVLAVLGAIVIPKFVGAGKTSKEAALKTDLQILRNAIQMFRSDTGMYPASLSVMTQTSIVAGDTVAPNGSGATLNDVNDYKGPYIVSVPDNPMVAGVGAEVVEWTYTPAAGTVRCPNTVSGQDEAGVSYKDY